MGCSPGKLADDLNNRAEAEYNKAKNAAEKEANDTWDKSKKALEEREQALRDDANKFVQQQKDRLEEEKAKIENRIQEERDALENNIEARKQSFMSDIERRKESVANRYLDDNHRAMISKATAGILADDDEDPQMPSSDIDEPIGNEDDNNENNVSREISPRGSTGTPDKKVPHYALPRNPLGSQGKRPTPIKDREPWRF